MSELVCDLCGGKALPRDNRIKAGMKVYEQGSITKKESKAWATCFICLSCRNYPNCEIASWDFRRNRNEITR